ncbi:MAG: response regulator [Woeseiaceae bacterium]|nr:response regulator [Woeseiaceae bacterium]
MNDKARILFVDDEKRVLNAMRGLFRRDYELYLTCEGAEAVKIAAENEIDVIVADQRMPGMTGIEVLSKIRQQSPRTVRILLTGYADPTAVEGSINQGEVFRFLSKPCPPKLLRDTLTLAIEASKTAPVETAAVKAPKPAQPAPQAAPKPATPPVQSVPQTPTPPAESARPEPAPALPSGIGMPPPPAPMPSAAISADDETQPALKVLNEEDIQGSEESHWQTVTSVVMSEDSVEETQEQVALTPANVRTREVGAVVFTVDPEFAGTAIRSLSEDRTAVLATTLVKVAQAIEENDIGVLITDFTSNRTILQKIVGTLKKHVPDLVTIVVSSGRDTTDMINLINYGQVFRYILKPIEGDKLRGEVNAAAVRHLSLAHNPESARRHHVLDAPKPDEPSESLNQFVGKIRDFKRTQTDPTDTIT